MEDVKLNELRGKRKTFPVYLKNFLSLYKKYESSIFCFVEGEDIKYYDFRVMNYTGEHDVNFVESGGKDGVLKFYENVIGKEEYRNLKALFFVDRDFDSMINNAMIYETPCYSIENLYTTQKAFENILMSEFNISRVDDDFDRCVQLFLDRQREFHSCALLLNSWIVCHRDIENKLLQEMKNKKTEVRNIPKLRLDKIRKITDLFDIRLDHVKSKYDIKKLEQIFPDAAEVPQSEIDKKMLLLSAQENQKVFRGKFELEFFRLFLDALRKAALDGDIRYFSKQHKVKLSLSKENVLSDLSRFADTPRCLRDYCSRRLSIVLS